MIVDVDLRGPFTLTIYNAETMRAKVRAFAAGRAVGDWITVRLPDDRVTCYEVTDRDGGTRPLDEVEAL